tara:strand:+ start:678 stop:1271 length:594 start_codon:yes stop_codon:yes gene_type:complete
MSWFNFLKTENSQKDLYHYDYVAGKEKESKPSPEPESEYASSLSSRAKDVKRDLSYPNPKGPPSRQQMLDVGELPPPTFVDDQQAIQQQLAHEEQTSPKLINPKKITSDEYLTEEEKLQSGSTKTQIDEGTPESDSDVGLTETQASVRQKLAVPFKGLDKQPIARLVEMFTDAGINIGGQRQAAIEATKYAKKVFKV